MNKTEFCPDAYFDTIYGSHPEPFSGVHTKEEYDKVCRRVTEGLKNAVAIDAIPGKIENASPVQIDEKKRKGYTVRTLKTEICKNLFMLSYVLLPDNPKRKGGIVAVCGHGYGCRQIFRQSKNGRYRNVNFFDNYQKNFAEALALDGHIVICPEPVAFGKARLRKDIHKPFYVSSCDTVSHHLLLYGISAASLRIYQTMKCLDILQKEYGCTQLGCMGISGGGLVALYTACLDKRISKVCVCGYINSFKTSVLSMWHCPDNYIPGLLRIGEMKDFASCLADRKLMMQFGKKDRLFPFPASEEAASYIRAKFGIANVPEHFFPVPFDGKHEVNLPPAIAFFKED